VPKKSEKNHVFVQNQVLCAVILQAKIADILRRTWGRGVEEKARPHPEYPKFFTFSIGSNI
jgi:hypothetical protein